jgi:signal transduction histidine kinase
MKDNLKRIGPAVERELAEWVMRRRHRQAERKVKQRTAELARANKQLKQYAAEIVRAQEEERKRIAYELHDDTAQYLSILKLQLDALLKSGKIQDTEIIEKLEYLQKDADRAFNDIRRYSHELRPVVLEHMGLAASLEQTADDINLLKEITVELELEGQEPPMADDIKLGLFRIAQEAINNVRKHARGSLATVCLQFKNSHVRLMVTDTGPGFDLQSAIVRKRKTGNLGLLSMRERAQLIGADLNIVSERGQGTTVTAEIKL